MKKYLCFLLAAVTIFLFSVPVSAAAVQPLIYTYDDMEIVPADEDLTIRFDPVPGAKSYIIIMKILKGRPRTTDTTNEECLPGCRYSYTVTSRRLCLDSELLVPGHYLKIYIEARDAADRQISNSTMYLFAKAPDMELTPDNPWYYIDTAEVPGILTAGSSGRYVKWLQQALNVICSSGLDVDGSFGNKNKSAVQRFQKNNGLSGNGSVNAATADALIRALEDVGCYAPYPAASGTVLTDFVCWQQNEKPLTSISLPADSKYFVGSYGCGAAALVNALAYLNGGVRYDDDTAYTMTKNICKKAGITRDGCYVYGMLTNSALRSEYGFDYIGTALHNDVGAALASSNAVAFVGVPNTDLRNDTDSKSSHVIVLAEYDPVTRMVFVLDSFEYVTSSGTHAYVSVDTYSAETAYGYWCELDKLHFTSAYFIDLKAPASAAVSDSVPQDDRGSLSPEPAEDPNVQSSAPAHSPKTQDDRGSLPPEPAEDPDVPSSVPAHSSKPQNNPDPFISEPKEKISASFSAAQYDLLGFTKVSD